MTTSMDQDSAYGGDGWDQESQGAPNQSPAAFRSTPWDVRLDVGNRPLLDPSEAANSNSNSKADAEDAPGGGGDQHSRSQASNAPNLSKTGVNSGDRQRYGEDYKVCGLPVLRAVATVIAFNVFWGAFEFIAEYTCTSGMRFVTYAGALAASFYAAYALWWDVHWVHPPTYTFLRMDGVPGVVACVVVSYHAVLICLAVTLMAAGLIGTYWPWRQILKYQC
mmetsp:Transcript_94828/g.271174  ORF Transcript_94828/g.271174 Transcript_94828/m.271174 type:complete len:221 (+) Transcript_94828:118-780(+)|eukprot:CAMPEP_0119516074 /NCGR_PEP_ID=MMETSP1344-20130328/33367_1 /TAXON_ID=236787 /ORGANISM="Florenciella parvula, Strain CCMP2471" /LENGTH=220 /DNA_ID=CAMNT_0007553535 /DNA_START=77 /DNA_END=739 /DNA_ORIENTATION=+